MKSRTLSMMPALGAFALMILMSQMSWAQAEIDPDHYSDNAPVVTKALPAVVHATKVAKTQPAMSHARVRPMPLKSSSMADRSDALISELRAEDSFIAARVTDRSMENYENSALGRNRLMDSELVPHFTPAR